MILQDWKFTKQAPYNLPVLDTRAEITIIEGATTIQDLYWNIQVKDVDKSAYVGYTDYKLRSYITDDFSYPTGVNILVTSDMTGTNKNLNSGASEYLPYTDNMKGVLRFHLSELLTKNNGQYRFTYRFEISAKNTLGIREDINIIILAFSVYKYAADEIYSFPRYFYIQQIIGNDVHAPKELAIKTGTNTTSWTYTTSADLTLSSDDPAVTIGVNGSGQPTATATGDRTIKVGISSAFLGVITPTSIAYGAEITYGAETLSDLVVLVNNIARPQILLFFTKIQGVYTTPAAEIQLDLESTYSIDNTNSYLFATPSPGMPKDILTIVPNYAASLIDVPAGVYEGSFTVVTSIGAVEFNFDIFFIYTIFDIISVPKPLNQLYFTLDLDYFILKENTPNRYFQLITNIVTRGSSYSDVTNYSFPQKLIPFKGEQKVNVGQLVHRLINLKKEYFEISVEYYPAEIYLQVLEKDMLTDEVYVEASLDVFSMIGGVSKTFDSLGLLDINPYPDRVTPAGFALVSAFLPIGEFNVETRRNGTLVGTIEQIINHDRVLTFQKTFSDFTPGDIITVSIAEQLGGMTEKTFIVFPEGLNSTMIVWDNEFLSQSALECTGDWELTSEYDYITSKFYEDFVEKIRNIDSTKQMKLNINTGWLLKTSVITIDSLLRSKRVWLLTGDFRIEITPITKKIINQDTTRELIEYSIEFILNRSSNEESYFIQ